MSTKKAAARGAPSFRAMRVEFFVFPEAGSLPRGG